MPKSSTTSVKNINGTSAKKYTHHNLGQIYNQNGGKERVRCAAIGCNNKVSATAHVMKSHGNAANTFYLTKTCAGHNNYHNTGDYTVLNSCCVPLKR